MIRFEHVQKWFGKHHVLKDISLEVKRGEICLLCGRSGAGKSTLLATANGIEPIQQGEIWIDGVALHRRGTDMRQLRTQVGVVYQHHNLFGHMSVEKNLRLGLEKALKLPKIESLRRARLFLDRVGLGHKWEAYPAELSGGEQQRVAIARCLAMQPKVMLLDEPTSALDAENAAQVVDTIRLLANEGITVLLSTHLIASFTDIAHCYVCMESGAITEGGRLERSLVELGAPSRLASLIHARRNTAETPIQPPPAARATG